MFKHLWGTDKKPSYGEVFCEKLVEQLFELGRQQWPEIEKDVGIILEKANKDINEIIQQKREKINLVDYYDAISTNFRCYLNEKNPNFNSQPIIDHDKNTKSFLKDISSVNVNNNFKELQSNDAFKMYRFNHKLKLARRYETLTRDKGKKEIKIMALGPSQVGKTALMKQLFGLDDKEVQLKGGLQSDTTEVETREKTINGITIKYSDSPGFLDSRGQDKENLQKIMDHLKNGVDIILWVIKIHDIVNSSYQKLLEFLTDQFGYKIWKKTIVVLTYANDKPPEEYFEDYDSDNESINRREILERAWATYTKEKKKLWNNTFRNVQKMYEVKKPYDVPVVLVENNKFNREKIDGVGVLIDGTPILETLMTQIFLLVEKCKAPYVFLAIAGNCENLEKLDYDEYDYDINVTDEIEMGPINSKDDVKLTERQIALDNASNKVGNNGSKLVRKSKGILGWCLLY